MSKEDNTLEEEWKVIQDFENYEVSTKGNIRIIKNKKLMKAFLNENGYFRISLTNKFTHSKKFYVHRLVAAAFIPNSDNKPTVNHINSICTDNNVNNLEWSSMKEQNQHKFKNNRKIERRCNIRSIWRINKDTNEKIELYESSTKAAKWVLENKLSTAENHLDLRASIVAVCTESNTKNKTAYGFKWVFNKNDKVSDVNETWKEIPKELINKTNYEISNLGNMKYKSLLVM